MASVSERIPSLVGGVSEQHPLLRRPSQCVDAVNWVMDPVTGLRRLPGWQAGSPSPKKSDGSRLTMGSGLFHHTITRVPGESYEVIVDTSGAVRVYRSEGTVATPPGANPIYEGTFPYLTTDDPRGDLRAVTVADTTFLVNRSQMVEHLSMESTGDGETAEVTHVETYVLSWNARMSYADTYGMGIHQPGGTLYWITIPYDTVDRRLNAAAPYGGMTLGEYAATRFGELHAALEAQLVSMLSAGKFEAYQLSSAPATDSPWDEALALEFTIIRKDSQPSVEFSTYPSQQNRLNSFEPYQTMTLQTGATTSGGAGSADRAILQVRTAAHSSTYTATVKVGNGRDTPVSVSATYTSPDTGEVTQGAIAEQLRLALVTQMQSLLTAGHLESYFVGSLSGSSFFVGAIPSGGNRWSIHAEDELGDEGLKLTRGMVSRHGDLPLKAIPGMTVEVAGSDTEPHASYWVVFDASSTPRHQPASTPGGGDASTYVSPTPENYLESGDSNLVAGVWREAMAPNAATLVASHTCPVVLTNTAEEVFTAKALTLNGRLVGDPASSPAPLFISEPIQDVVFYRDRLGFVCPSGLVMSATGDYGNFWRTTVMQVLDSDPIDVTIQAVGGQGLEAGAVLDGELLLMSSRDQHRVDAPDLLTPKTISVIPVSQHRMDLSVRPVVYGTTLYYVTTTGTNTAVHEFRRDSTGRSYDSFNLTEQCPQYLKGSATSIAVLGDYNLLVLLTDGSDDMYVYQWLDGNAERLQSAWHRWSPIPNQLAVPAWITATNEGLVLWEHWTYDDSLDQRRQQVAALRDAAWVLEQGAAFAYHGESSITLSEPVYRRPGADGQLRAVTEGRFQVRDMTLTFGEHQGFTVEVTPENRPTFVETVSTNQLGFLKIGAATAGVRTERVEIGHAAEGMSIKLTVSGTSDCNIQSILYTGRHTKRARRF